MFGVMPPPSRWDEVVATAARLFAERGYHATSIEHLLAETGLTRGGLYHYIDGKHDLLIAVQRELLEPLLERARALVAEHDEPEEQLRAVVREWVRHVETHRDHMVVFAAERRLVESDPRWAEIRDQRDAFESLLAGIVPGGSITRLALLGMVNHMPSWYDEAGRLSATEIADRFVDLLLTGVRRPPARA
jgi:TetR/AcrR family transcriptional regulator, cholesterol catabolism regulator